MKLKKAILEQLGRDELKAICQALELEDVDLRSVESMSAKVSRAHRAEPAFLFQYLSEQQVKAVAERIGSDATGRKTALIEAMLTEAEGLEDIGDQYRLSGKAQERPTKTARRQGGGRTRRSAAVTDQTEQYRHEAEAVQRPDVGIQDQFQAKKPPKTYRYDSSLDPALSWDEQRERDLGEWLLGLIERAAKEGEKAVFAEAQEWKGGGVRVASTADAVRVLKDISQPFLNWAGKAERHQIEVPTVPLFVHERHSTKAILDGIRHRKARGSTLDLFGDPNMDIRDQLEAYEHKGPWQNRMILGDSLSVMNSLLEFEGLGGQVQMIYIDPPYGVKFGSNFQPFVRKRDVKHGGDEDMTREPEMVKAYRDTWELGLHSYLTYLRDRLVLARELLTTSGSVFVQISDENLHNVRDICDEVFGRENFCAVIPFVKTSGKGGSSLDIVNDFLLWYSRDKSLVKYIPLYKDRSKKSLDQGYTWIELDDGKRRRLTAAEIRGEVAMPEGRRFITAPLNSQSGGERARFPVTLDGITYTPTVGYWKTNPTGMEALRNAKRLIGVKKTLSYVRYETDFSVVRISNWWGDTQESTFAADKMYVVHTYSKVLE